MLMLFGSTYVWEQTFSVMNINKACHGNTLNAEHLGSILQIATTKLTPDFDALKKKREMNNPVPNETECEFLYYVMKFMQLMI